MKELENKACEEQQEEQEAELRSHCLTSACQKVAVGLVLVSFLRSQVIGHEAMSSSYTREGADQI